MHVIVSNQAVVAYLLYGKMLQIDGNKRPFRGNFSSEVS